MQRTPKPLPYTQLDGISADQLAQHHDVLYTGYVKKLSEIEEQLPHADRESANGTYSELGELMRQQAFATNGVTLHEWYFESLAKGGVEPSSDFKRIIAEQFGSWDDFLGIFMAAGLAARGWVVLAYSLYDGALHVYSQDAHDKGAIWASVPLLIMDVYEHAYMIDYGVKRKDYLKAFSKNIDWSVVAKRHAAVKGWQL
ncbi:MAG: Fe-Mn family superoxide dismutase [bacterium]|nr:Fe-Mn family superoxide dismutase [bacterium]